MKFCYLDESGTGAEPYSVMVGVVVDGYRMGITKEHWREVLELLSEVAERPIREFHAKKFYAGDGIWKDIDGPTRAEIVSEIMHWFVHRGHYVVYSTVDRQKFDASFPRHQFGRDIGSLWRLLAFHVVLALQKHHQKEKKNKGNTVLVFDEQIREKDAFTTLILDPPAWCHSYYDRQPDQEILDQIIDVPHFVGG